MSKRKVLYVEYHPRGWTVYSDHRYHTNYWVKKVVNSILPVPGPLPVSSLNGFLQDRKWDVHIKDGQR